MSDREEGQPSGMNRADFVKRLAAGAFAVPVITSFAMDGLAQASVTHQWPNQVYGQPDGPGAAVAEPDAYPNQTYPNQTHGWPPVRPPQDNRWRVLQRIFGFFGHGF